MNKKAIGLITANYKTSVPCALSKRRPMAGLPFAGRYRLIDFPLSNMVNAGIRTVGLIVPQNYRSLLDHVGTGRDWMLDRKNGGLFILPGTVYGGMHEGFRFLLRDIIDNKALLIRDSADYVVLSGSNMVVNLDLEAAIEAHEASGNAATIICHRASAINDDVYGLKVEGDKVVGLTHGVKYGDLESVDYCIFNRDELIDVIENFSQADYMALEEAMFKAEAAYSIGYYEFDGYAAGVYDAKSYYDRTMDIRKPEVYEALFNPERTIFTKAHDAPPAKYFKGSVVRDSLISAGCRISGTVRGSALGRGVVVEPGAVVSNSIVMQSCVIESGARVENAIIDRYNLIPSGTELRGTPDDILIKEKAEYV